MSWNSKQKSNWQPTAEISVVKHWTVNSEEKLIYKETKLFTTGTNIESMSCKSCPLMPVFYQFYVLFPQTNNR